MKNFNSFHGMVTNISDFHSATNNEDTGCYKLMSVTNSFGSLVNFVAAPDTYFIDHVTIHPYDMITGFYDANAPTILIFPPQYKALVVSMDAPGENVKVDYFNSELISSDNTLKLNLSLSTEIILENDQLFTGNLRNRYLIVIYGPSTKSIPAQTIPYKIIVMC
ncbi:hypothetical protein BJV85_002489 [Clostridium acetobutylicum]|uniref:Orf18 n=1 Tax=Clostridium acetobutylicum (strain ATCC 824 / DSM 792 / JCM 1419 / IAM 19013 / LMG 5710 / NBRC 13948 / NRRL B-527 / VKM B-1787 / 2291 / W) TaxID=272562 RepID=O65996_CLOAB|nr:MULTISPECIES: hypothetical protein [Clostridium]AAC12855.1 orf18 [Clostridium acetobutylicum ATCC 824]AAK79475.1 Hypothetical protein CA_C1508 [Clostridium acetobutylicum ATCC 824]ADZ20560.1 Conserved hypothetical protein [Clostridium acetobutylicum EA 2018]AEI31847.1 hypothetical protein SMB_G1533 [Clostridium acetobutylicum DSM 1731]AWV81280.1 hypothetical protein DK921_14505 [Clostridium acetobutylicum]